MNKWLDEVTQQVERYCQFEITEYVCIGSEDFGPRIKQTNKKN
jgi:hypothetical protein